MVDLKLFIGVITSFANADRKFIISYNTENTLELYPDIVKPADSTLERMLLQEDLDRKNNMIKTNGLKAIKSQVHEQILGAMDRMTATSNTP